MTKVKPKKVKIPPKPDQIKEKEELFCQLYAGYGDRSCMNNGVLSYITAWQIDTSTSRMLRKWKGKKEPAYWDYTAEYKAAKTAAHKLLTKGDIRVRIHQLFKILFSADVVDSELLSVIMQEHDPKAKVMAIKEFNELKGRITKKIKLSGELKSTLSPERVREIAKHIATAKKEK